MTLDPGTKVYIETYSGAVPADQWPWTFEGWERLAREKLPPPNFDYVAGGAGAESTQQANSAAFFHRRLVPRMLGENVERSLGVDVLGTHSPAPFLLAPVGVQSIVHPEGELATARAARELGVPMILSSASTHSIEAVAETLAGSPAWFQLYWYADHEIARSFVQRAQVAGYRAIVVTLDTLRLGWRPRDLGRGYLPFWTGEGIGNFTTDPYVRSKFGADVVDDPLRAGPTALAEFTNLALSWKDLGRLREWTDLPLVLKGVLHPDDARRAVEAGVQGVIVSNHGGRQVDGAIAALDALEPVVQAAQGDLEVLFDSGIRTGPDVLKAFALGARAVLLGRPYVYGLAAGGSAGVRRVAELLLADVDVTLSLLGAHSVAELDRSWLA